MAPSLVAHSHHHFDKDPSRKVTGVLLPEATVVGHLEGVRYDDELAVNWATKLEKHEMRLAFAAQLSELFKSDELLLKPFSMSGAEYGETVADLAQKYRRGEYSFWPIVRESMHMVCDLDILFLRRASLVALCRGMGTLIIESRCSLMCCACQQMRMRFAVSVLMRTKEYFVY